MNSPPAQIVLASASRARRALLAQCGLDFSIHVSRVDEDDLKQNPRFLAAEHGDLAQALADAKARDVLDQLGTPKNTYIIGADQILVCDGKRFDKPKTMAEAASHLAGLQGKTHQLISACCIYNEEMPAWTCVETASLTMRPLSTKAIDHYLDGVGDAALTSVGCYQLEGLGALLFDEITGDYYTILGLPLLPVLSYLRTQKVISE